MSIFFGTKRTEKDRYVSNFGLAIEEAERFEAMQVEDLVRDELGNRQPYVVEWFLVPGVTKDTMGINACTFDDVWENKMDASIELNVVVFDSERQKELYLQSKLKN